jgi:hypothetical protein
VGGVELLLGCMICSCELNVEQQIILIIWNFMPFFFQLQLISAGQLPGQGQQVSQHFKFKFLMYRYCSIQGRVQNEAFEFEKLFSILACLVSSSLSSLDGNALTLSLSLEVWPQF